VVVGEEVIEGIRIDLDAILAPRNER